MPSAKKVDKTSPKEFWAWEYQRRNKQYLADYKQWETDIRTAITDYFCDAPKSLLERILDKNFFNNDEMWRNLYESGEPQKHMGESKALRCHSGFLIKRSKLSKAFQAKHGRYPTDPSLGWKPENILKALLEGPFLHNIQEDFFRDFPHFDIKFIDGHIHLKIDTSRSIKELEAALRYYYGCEKNEPALRMTARKQLSRPVKNEKKFKASPVSSAIGLWIWDHMKQFGTTRYKAVVAFQNQYENELNKNRFGRQFKDESPFHQAYNLIRKYIGATYPTEE